MISTVVEMCNHALSLLGESRISSLEDSTERARLCNLLYNQTRDELLAGYEWPFAISRRALAAVDEPNLTPFEYRYALPSDYLKMLHILDDSTYKKMINYRVVTLDYVIEENRLLTDVSPCYIRYVKRLEDPSKYPELFAQAFSLSLASKLAPRLSQNFSLAAQMAQAAYTALTVAKAEIKKDSLPTPTRKEFWTGVN